MATTVNMYRICREVWFVRHVSRQTDRQTDTMIAILGTPIGAKL